MARTVQVVVECSVPDTLQDEDVAGFIRRFIDIGYDDFQSRIDDAEEAEEAVTEAKEATSIEVKAVEVFPPKPQPTVQDLCTHANMQHRGYEWECPDCGIAGLRGESGPDDSGLDACREPAISYPVLRTLFGRPWEVAVVDCGPSALFRWKQPANNDWRHMPSGPSLTLADFGNISAATLTWPTAKQLRDREQKVLEEEAMQQAAASDNAYLPIGSTCYDTQNEQLLGKELFGLVSAISSCSVPVSGEASTLLAVNVEAVTATLVTIRLPNKELRAIPWDDARHILHIQYSKACGTAPLQRKISDRYRTAEEAAKDAEIIAQVKQEFPPATDMGSQHDTRQSN